MSKFNNPKAFATVAPPSGALQLPLPVPAAAPETTVVAAAPESAPRTAAAPEEVSTFQRLGFIVLCTYLLSGYANDLSIRYFHTKTYFTLIAELVLPLLLLLSGAAFRSMRRSVGKFWLIYFIWLVIDLPFSVWRGGTAQLLIDYGIKNWSIFFYIAAFAVTLTTVRRFMYVQVVSSLLLLLTCYAFGRESADGRLGVTGSLFFENPNELAMNILFGISALLFIVLRGSMPARIFALLAITGSMIYALRTASRGGLLGSLAAFICITMISKYKVPILGFSAVIAVLAAFLVPSQTMDRLKLAFSRPSVYEAKTDDELSAIASAMQRRELLQRSVVVALTHPVFGVGPGQFAVSENGESAKKGQWSSWLGTHNSYTQVAAECGLPAFFCYMAVIVFCFRANFRIVRATRKNPIYADLYAMSVCTLVSMTIYAVCTFFDHIAYSAQLAILGGYTLSLTLLAENEGILQPRRIS